MQGGIARYDIVIVGAEVANIEMIISAVVPLTGEAEKQHDLKMALKMGL